LKKKHVLHCREKKKVYICSAFEKKTIFGRVH